MHTVGARWRARVWLLALVLPSSLAAARLPWEGAAFSSDPADIARAAAAVAPDAGESVVVLLSEASYSYDDAGRETYIQRNVYRIVGPGAHESWSAVDEQWSPWHQEKPRIRARVITPDGRSHPLDPAGLTENGVLEKAPYMFEDDRVLRGPLPAAGPGAVVEQEVILEDRQPFFDAGVVRYHGLKSGVAVRLSRLTLESPAQQPFSWIARGLGEIAPRETVAGGRRRLVFEVADLAAFEAPEPGLPPEAPAATYIAFSTGKSWNAVAGRYSAIVDQAMAGADLAGFLRSAQADGPSQLESVERLLDAIGREVRYTGLELGAGGLIPRRPGETLQSKFGDCKDKAVLLAALLRAVEIPAYVALLSAGEGEPDIEPSLPGMGGFNHAIVMVPGNPPVWIDPTDRFARAGELPLADQGRLALVASPTAAALVRTPESISTDNRDFEVREITLAELGKGRMVETGQYWGASDRDLRSYYTSGDPQTVRANLSAHLARAYRADEVTGMTPGDAVDLSRPFTVGLTAERVGFAVTDLREAVVAVNLSSLLDRLPAEISAPDDASAPRPADYVFSRPFVHEIVYRVTAPAGFALQPLPASRTRQLGSATLTEEYSAEPDGVVVAKVSFDSGKRRLTPGELAALQTAVAALQDEDAVLIRFKQVGESLLEAGQVPEALAELRRLSESAPQKALPHSRLARALLAGGMAEAARQQARRAVALEPDLVVAWRDLGWILEHDLLGRHRQPGFDLEGALDAYREAVALDPDHAVARGSLAILLEHNAQGERYGPGADLTAAITEYQAIDFSQLTAEIQPNLLVALLRAGRPQEIKTEAARLADSPDRSVLEVVATGMLDGADAALAETQRKFPGADARVQALSSAAQILVGLRRYGEAASLLERAGRQAAKPAELLARAELLRQVRPTEPGATVADDTPAGVVRAALSTIFSSPFDPGAFARYFARALTAHAGTADHAEIEQGLTEGLGSMREALRAGDVSLDVTRDLVMAWAKERVEGSDEAGYRVRLEIPFVDDDDQVVFVVREDGRYRLALVGTDLQGTGFWALAHARRGELAAARQWLDWATEEIDRGGNEDPLARSSLLALWKAGEEAPLEVVRCAAAALAAGGPDTETALPVLASCRAEETDPARRTALDAALAQAHEELEQWDELLALARQLRAALPGSDLALLYECHALHELGRLRDARDVARARVAEKPGDSFALRVLAGLTQELGELDQTETLLQRLTEGGKALSLDFNNRAWLALVRGKADEQAAEWARKATTLSGYQSAESLHTLAAIYAEQGKTAEAYRVLVESLEVKPDGLPEGHDWYVLGRLAEHYGLADEARRYYRMVEPEPDPANAPSSTYTLASRRLAVLGKK